MASIINKFIVGFLLIMSIFFVTACAKEKVDEATQFVAPSSNDYLWSITLNKWEIADDLKGTQSAQQYNGDVIQNQISESPSEGCTFLLVELTIEKQKSGASSFVWKNLYITDEQGNQYFRLPNDTFLKNYNFPRIKSTDLTIGSSKGFIVIEIPKSISKESLTLVYESAEGKNKISLSK